MRPTITTNSSDMIKEVIRTLRDIRSFQRSGNSCLSSDGSLKRHYPCLWLIFLWFSSRTISGHRYFAGVYVLDCVADGDVLLTTNSFFLIVRSDPGKLCLWHIDCWMHFLLIRRARNFLSNSFYELDKVTKRYGVLS